MSIPEQIRTLEELASIDAELKALDDQLNQERATIDSLRAALKRLDDKRKGDLVGVATTEKTRAELLADVRTMMQQVEHSREKLNRSRSEREANAAQRELEELRKLVRDREEDIEKLAAEADAVRAQIALDDVEIQKLQAELGPIEADERSSKVAEVEKQRNEKAGGRAAILKRLPSPLQRRYETLHTKKPNPVSHTTDGTCAVCHMALPPQIFHQLSREPMIAQCPSCQRLIYFAPPTRDQDADAKESAAR